ncbi:MAG: glycosyltransferase family protein [Patescibacteria group bacterium]
MLGRVHIIVQARMGSTRLPGKSMKDLSGQPVLWHVLQRVQAAKRADDVIVATSTNAEDDVIEDACKTWRFKYFRGSSDNVLERFHGAALTFGTDVAVRITGDCPLIDPKIIDIVINGLDGNDYVSNVFDRDFPRGMDTEVFTFKVLDQAQREAITIFDREHVTPYIRSHEQLFKTANINMPMAYHFPKFRLVIDTPEDYTLLEAIYKEFYQPGKLIDVPTVLGWLNQHPEIAKINSTVEQKPDPKK